MSRNFGITNKYKNDAKRAVNKLWTYVESAVLALEGEQTAFRATNIVNGNIADRSAYTVAAATNRNDNVANVEGDVVLLVGQTTAAENGLYVVGAVSGGTAPLTRSAKMASGSTLSDVTVEIQQGAIYAKTKWFNTANAPVIGTTDPAFMPEAVTVTAALVAGTVTVTTIPVLSATRSGISATRQATGGTVTTTIMYVVNGAPTPGVLGTATFAVMAAVAAGTIQNADTSTLKITVTNR